MANKVHAQRIVVAFRLILHDEAKVCSRGKIVRYEKPRSGKWGLRPTSNIKKEAFFSPRIPKTITFSTSSYDKKWHLFKIIYNYEKRSRTYDSWTAVENDWLELFLFISSHEKF